MGFLPPGSEKCELGDGVRQAAEGNLPELDEVRVPGHGEEVEVGGLHGPGVAGPVLQLIAKHRSGSAGGD